MTSNVAASFFTSNGSNQQISDPRHCLFMKCTRSSPLLLYTIRFENNWKFDQSFGVIFLAYHSCMFVVSMVALLHIYFFLSQITVFIIVSRLTFSIAHPYCPCQDKRISSFGDSVPIALPFFTCSFI